MPRLSIALLPAIVAISTTALTAKPAGGLSIILFGARWCAPCMIEYGNLEELASAAAPDQLTLAWIDRKIDVPAKLMSRVGGMNAAQARSLATIYAGSGYGLPFSVILNAAGKPCAMIRGTLSADRINTMRRECLQTAAPLSMDRSA